MPLAERWNACGRAACISTSITRPVERGKGSWPGSRGTFISIAAGPIRCCRRFESAAKEAGFPATQVLVEYFTAKEEPALAGGFVVELARSGKAIPIQPGKTILDTLLEHGIDAPHSCTQGVCTTCETRVLSGVPDQRDLVLTEAERAANQTTMICCSGSKTAKLVLDL